MKKEYDFKNAEQGKFYIPIEELNIPIYLDEDDEKEILSILANEEFTSNNDFKSKFNL
jgi:hypothetical protein